MPPKKVYPCIICKENVKEREPSGSIDCHICKRYTHVKCDTKLEAGALKYFLLLQEATGAHSYTCEGCAFGLSELSGRVTELATRMKKVEGEVAKVTESSSRAAEKADKVADDLVLVKKTLSTNKEDTIEAAKKALSMELREREARKVNVVLYGMEEASHNVTQGWKRKELDMEQIADMFNQLGLEIAVEDDIKFAARIGELKTDQQADPRPVKLAFRSVQLRESLLANTRKLPRTDFARVSIVPDLTELQRNEDKELTEEAEKLTEELNTEDRKNWEFRCVGRKGERVIRKVKKTPNNPNTMPLGQRGGRGRGGTRGARRGGSRGRGGSPVRRGIQRPTFQPTRAVMDNTQEEVEEGIEEEENDDGSRKRARNTSGGSSPGHSGTPKKQKRAEKQREQSSSQ